MNAENKGGAVDPPIAANFATIMDSVSRRISGSGVPLLDAITQTVAAGAGESVESGGDLTPRSKAIIMGVMQGAGATNEAALKALSHAARVLIRHTANLNGNLAGAIKGIVLGAIASARKMGVEPAQAASTAAQGGLEGASEAGSVTVERVKAALKEPIGGSKVVLLAPLAT